MIRKAEINDIPKIVRMEKDVFGHTLGAELLYTEITSNPFSYILVMEEESKVIGYIGFRLVDEYAELMNFCIIEGEQNKGYGKTLFKYVLFFLMDNGAKYLTLEVRESNTRAINFYESFGFKFDHIRENYYGTENGLVYIKEFD